MKCPICKIKLVVTGQERLETLEEHVSDPNGEISVKDKYQCPNKECAAYKNDVCWNINGEYYGTFTTPNVPMIFIDNNDGPFGSFQRETNVSIYKQDEDHTIYKGKKWRVDVKYRYTADRDGNILTRKSYLQFFTKDEVGWIYHTWGIKMLIHSIKHFYLKRKIRTDKPYEISCWELRVDSNWWRKASALYLKLFHSKDIKLGEEKYPTSFKRSRLFP